MGVFAIKLQKSYGCGVHHKICWCQLHTFLEHKILRETVFLETSMRLLSGISSMFGNTTLDLFASCIDYLIDRYISCKSDPEALAIDAFQSNGTLNFIISFPLLVC